MEGQPIEQDLDHIFNSGVYENNINHQCNGRLDEAICPLRSQKGMRNRRKTVVE